MTLLLYKEFIVALLCFLVFVSPGISVMVLYDIVSMLVKLYYMYIFRKRIGISTCINKQLEVKIGSFSVYSSNGITKEQAIGSFFTPCPLGKRPNGSIDESIDV